MTSLARHTVLTLLLTLTLCVPSAAQWSDNPGQNLAIADRSGEQVQAKIRPTSDGGCYVSWFDNSTGGYDVYLQKLDSDGNELWAHNGVLVADRSFSSTQDYGLDVDGSDNAVLIFRHDHTGSEQVNASLISPAGTLLWGTNGVQLTTGTAFFAAPKVAATTDGYYVVGWTHDDDTVVQKLNSSGVDQWSGGVTLSDTGLASFSISDIKASDSGAAIVSWVKWGPEFWDPKHLYAQKLSTTGSLLWGSSHVAVFDGSGSLQFGNFPTFETDGSGGAVFSWYEVSPLQCWAQRVLSNGSEAFAHNGVAVSTHARERVSPVACFDPANSNVLVFWREQLPGPSPEDGIYGQKIDSSGVRQWGDQGIVVEGLSTTEKTQVRCLPYATGAMIFFVEALSFGNDRLYGARVDGSGNHVWSPNILSVSINPSDKSRVAPTLSTDGVAFLAWTDDRDDSGDVYGQNVTGDGELGDTGPKLKEIRTKPTIDINSITP